MPNIEAPRGVDIEKIHMKLAEALSKRAGLIQRVQQLKTRLNDCLKVQEGDTPAETPEDVVKELDSTLGELRRLIYLINLTNTATMVDGRSITALLAERDTLAMRVKTLNDGLQLLTAREDRYNRNEIKYVRTMDINDFRRLCDKSSAQLREFDLKIQGLGWIHDLVEE